MWNFKKTNWPEFSKKVDDLVGDGDDDSPYLLVTKLCDPMRKSANIAIPRRKMHKYKPFCTKELTNQRNKRDQAQEKEKSEGKDEEQTRICVINWRRQCAIITKQINLSKKATWNKFMGGIDYRTDGPKAYRLFTSLNNKHNTKQSHPVKVNNQEVMYKMEIASSNG